MKKRLRIIEVSNKGNIFFHGPSLKILVTEMAILENILYSKNLERLLQSSALLDYLLVALPNCVENLYVAHKSP